MNYVEEVKKIVEDCVERRKEIDDEVEAVRKDELLSATGIEEKVSALKIRANELVISAYKELISLREQFAEVAEKSTLIDGSMNNEDAAIFMSGIELTVAQFEDIVSRNVNNPFLISLAKKYIDEHKGFTATLPLSVPQVVKNFNEYIDIATNMLHEPSGSLKVVFFLDEKRGYVPEGAERFS